MGNGHSKQVRAGWGRESRKRVRRKGGGERKGLEVGWGFAGERRGEMGRRRGEGGGDRQVGL